MFGKFMNKKFFHPGSYPNVKMRWIHEQRDTAKKKAEEEKQSTYQKEQESYQSRMLSAKSTEEKMKLDLNFLYDLPPGMKTEKDKENDDNEEEVEVKFEWQKHAPRSKYINDLGLDCQDQPFGVLVRNIRCFKCKAWGHQNTDRECPLYFTNVNSEAVGNSQGKGTLRLSDPLLLVGAMKEQHGISLKKSVIGQEIDPMADNQRFIPSDEDEDELGKDDVKFVESLTNKQKRKLLKRLNKLEKHENKEKKKLKKGASFKKKKKKRYSSSEDEEQDDKKVSRKNSSSYKRQLRRKRYSSSSDKDVDDTSSSKNVIKRRTNSSSVNDEDQNYRKKVSRIKTKDFLIREKNINHRKRKISSSSEDEDQGYSKIVSRTKTKDKYSLERDKNVNHRKRKNSSNSDYSNHQKNERNYSYHEFNDRHNPTGYSRDFSDDDMKISSYRRHRSDSYSKNHHRDDGRNNIDNKSFPKEFNKRHERVEQCDNYDEVDEKLHEIRKWTSRIVKR